MSAFSDMHDALFADTNMAEDVTYTPPAGSPVAVRAIFAGPDKTIDFGGGDFTAAQITAEIRTSQVASPARNARIDRGAVVYMVTDYEADALRLVNVLTLRKI